MIKLIDKLTKQDMKSNIARGLKLSEECGELAEAILSSEGICGCEYKGKTSEDVLEEAVDVTIMALSIFCGHCPEELDKSDKFVEMLTKKLSKWQSKVEESREKRTINVCNSDGYCLLDGNECTDVRCEECMIYKEYSADRRM